MIEFRWYRDSEYSDFDRYENAPNGGFKLQYRTDAGWLDIPADTPFVDRAGPMTIVALGKISAWRMET